tara:strand:+ start:121 stop:321 length:201 start_codon:yes stop_codon:yes gene_type:complete
MSDTSKRIIYKRDDGGVGIIIPAEKCDLTIDQIAAKDVPAGKPFTIVNVSEIPTDRTYRGAWTYED